MCSSDEEDSTNLGKFLGRYQGPPRRLTVAEQASFDARKLEASIILVERASQRWNAPPAVANHNVDPLLDFDLSSIPPSTATSALELFTHAIVNPAADDECAICKDDFEDVPGISPNICHHTYHLDCLSHWFERQRGEGDYRCCLCTRVMCTQKEHRDLDGPKAPFWLNPGNDKSHEPTLRPLVYRQYL
jgi:hypothetical protein